MSYNGSGTFVVNSSGQPVVTGTVISSTAFNALTADLATGLSTAITKDGQTTTTSRILFAQGISSTLTTDATSATTGSIITAGGISTQKALWVGTTSRLVGNVQADANIGIGCSPAAPLNISGSGAMIRLDGPSTTSSAHIGFTHAGVGVCAIGLDISGGSIIASSPANSIGIRNDMNAILFSTGGSGLEVARFDTSGNLLVGTATTGGWTTVAKLEVVAGTGNQALSGYNSGSSGNALVLRTDNDNSNLINFNRNGVAAGTFVSTGGGTPNIQWLANNQAYVIAGGSGGVTLASAATAWAAVSDETLKTDLAPIQSGAEKVGSLRAVTGRYKTDAESMSRSFLIAQDVQKVLPEAVSTDADGTLSLRYTEVIPLMVAAIQELTTRLAALENK